MNPFQNWSEGWILPGYYISYRIENTIYFEQVIRRDFGHYVYDWVDATTGSTIIAAGATGGPQVPDLFELTKGYDSRTNLNQIWQWICGLNRQVYLYIELPTDTHRHGIPKVPKPRPNLRQVSHFQEFMSPYLEPSFVTEHFFKRPDLDRVALEVYNPNAEGIQNLRLRFLINKMELERIGVVAVTRVQRENGKWSVTVDQQPADERWSEVLDKLYRKLIPCRPLSMYPVQAPAEAHD